jgi:hypothetical protein
MGNGFIAPAAIIYFFAACINDLIRNLSELSLMNPSASFWL